MGSTRRLRDGLGAMAQKAHVGKTIDPLACLIIHRHYNRRAKIRTISGMPAIVGIAHLNEKGAPSAASFTLRSNLARNPVTDFG
jgi:hypothetical protein